MPVNTNNLTVGKSQKEKPDPKADYCTPLGAKRLSDQIEQYWRERGIEVKVTRAPAGFLPSMRSARVDLRSNIQLTAVRPRASDSKGRVEKEFVGKTRIVEDRELGIVRFQFHL